MDETNSPPSADPVCAWEGCGLPVPESRGTKPRRYCKRSCRQRAYEARRRREEIAAAVGAAVLRERSAMDVPKNVTVTPSVPSKNVTVTAVERHSDAPLPWSPPPAVAPARPAWLKGRPTFPGAAVRRNDETPRRDDGGSGGGGLS